MRQNIDKAIAICLGLQCPSGSRYVRDIKAKHNPLCAKYIYSIEQILTSQTLNDYPPNELGRTVKGKLSECRRLGKEGYLQVILDGFKHTVEKIIDGIKDDLSAVYPLNHLQKCYNDVYSLEPIKALIRDKASSNVLTEQLKLMTSNKKINRLKQTNDHLDQIQSNLNLITVELSHLVTSFKKNVLLVKKDLADKTIDFQKQFSTDEIIYGVAKTNYPGGKSIRFEGGWIQFPLSLEDSFKPWIYSEKGFTTGVHKLKIVAEKPFKSANCGIALIKQSDLHSYPYSIYKSLYDRVTRQFKLVSGPEIYTFIDSQTEVYLTMDLNEKKATLYDGNKRCQYVCSLKQSTVYYFGLVGSQWRARILHLS